jgi:hypothetical protein
MCCSLLQCVKTSYPISFPGSWEVDWGDAATRTGSVIQISHRTAKPQKRFVSIEFPFPLQGVRWCFRSAHGFVWDEDCWIEFAQFCTMFFFPGTGYPNSWPRSGLKHSQPFLPLHRKLVLRKGGGWPLQGIRNCRLFEGKPTVMLLLL